MNFKPTYFTTSLILFAILSTITTIATILSPILDKRLILTSIMYVFLSLTFLGILALLANNFHNKVSHFVYVLITSLYTIGYTLASVSFIATHQILRKQTFVFVYQIFPKLSIFIVIFLITIVSLGLLLLLNKKINISPDHKYKNKVWIITIVGAFILIAFIFVMPGLFKIFNPLVEGHIQGNPIYIPSQPLNSEKLIEDKTSLENPNVIVILLESVSAERIHSYGYERNVTPNIDRLAKDSIFFENALSTATHSDYAQPAFLSSRYMLTNDLRNFFREEHERKMIWDVFGERDYFTAYFSSQDDLWAEMNEYFNFENLDIYSYSLTDEKYDYGSGLGKKDLDHKTMDKTLDWLEDYDDEEPFFLYLNLQATHLPLSYPKEYKIDKPDFVISLGFTTLTSEENTNNRMDNAMRYVDAQIGRLIDELENRNELDNTVIILSSDHGHDFFNRHKIDGHGNSVYNDELQVPLFMYIPDLEPRNISIPVSNIDGMPTFLDILNIEVPEEFMGKTMSKENRFFFYSQNHKHFIGMYKDNLKIIVDLNKKTAEIFDITKDFNEENNLIDVDHYDEYLLELLMWHTCQINYFSKMEKDPKMEKYCRGFEE